MSTFSVGIILPFILSQVAKKFSELHVHRLFVADHHERMNLIGVISLSDVIKLLYYSISQKKLASKGRSKTAERKKEGEKKEGEKKEGEKKDGEKKEVLK